MTNFVHKFKVFWYAKLRPKFNGLFDFRSLFYYWLFVCFLAVAFFFIPLFQNNFVISYSGDYTMQQIPFYLNGYDDWWTFFTTGKLVLWDSNTFLGADSITSNSFYYYFNPFFLPILLFPRSIVPQGMAILMILKIVMAAFTMRLYLKYMGCKESTARLFGICYAFCGWNIFYLWFNHMMEICALLPLMLLGIEKVLKENKPWMLILAIFVIGITNYFYIVVCCIGGVFYAIFRFVMYRKNYNTKTGLITFTYGVVAFAVGLLLSCFVIYPAIKATGEAARASSPYLSVWFGYIQSGDIGEAIKLMFVWQEFYGEEHAYQGWYAFLSFFFPPNTCRYTPLAWKNSYDKVACSMFMYTPVIMLLFPSILKTIKEKKYGQFAVILLVGYSLFNPFIYYLFTAFTSIYGRWEIIPTIFIIAYVAISFDKREKEDTRLYYLGGAIGVVSTVVCFVMALNFVDNYASFYEMTDDQLLYACFQIAISIIYYFVICLTLDRKYFYQIITFGVMIEVIVCGNVVSEHHGITSYQNTVNGGLSTYEQEVNLVNEIKAMSEDKYYRIKESYYTGYTINQGMAEGYNGTTFFHSSYNYNVDQFLLSSHVVNSYNNTNGVRVPGYSGKLLENRIYLDEFLGVKYILVRNQSGENSYYFGDKLYKYTNVPLGYTKVDSISTENYTVYENSNYLAGGFSYDTLYNRNWTEDTSRPYECDFFKNTDLEVIRNDRYLLSGAYLDNDEVSDIQTDSQDYNVINIFDKDSNGEYIQKDSRLITYGNKIHYTCGTGRNRFDPDNPLDKSTCSISTSGSAEPSTDRISIEPLAGQNSLGNMDLKEVGHQGAYYQIRWQYSSSAWVYLIGMDGQIVSAESLTTDNGGFKYIRTFYSNVPLKEIVITPNVTTSLSGNQGSLFIDTYDYYMEKINNLKAYKLENVNYSTNHFDFTTNYDKERFIVLSTPYDKGWSVTATDKDGNKKNMTVYNAQGGFVGFRSLVGETTYSVDFFTYNLKQGLILSGVGLIALGGGIAVTIYMSKKKRPQDEVNENVNSF